MVGNYCGVNYCLFRQCRLLHDAHAQGCITKVLLLANLLSNAEKESLCATLKARDISHVETFHHSSLMS